MCGRRRHRRGYVEPFIVVPVVALVVMCCSAIGLQCNTNFLGVVTTMTCPGDQNLCVSEQPIIPGADSVPVGCAARSDGVKEAGSCNGISCFCDTTDCNAATTSTLKCYAPAGIEINCYGIHDVCYYNKAALFSFLSPFGCGISNLEEGRINGSCVGSDCYCSENFCNTYNENPLKCYNGILQLPCSPFQDLCVLNGETPAGCAQTSGNIKNGSCVGALCYCSGEFCNKLNQNLLNCYDILYIKVECPASKDLCVLNGETPGGCAQTNGDIKNGSCVGDTCYCSSHFCNRFTPLKCFGPVLNIQIPCLPAEDLCVKNGDIPVGCAQSLGPIKNGECVATSCYCNTMLCNEPSITENRERRIEPSSTTMILVVLLIGAFEVDLF